MEKKMDLLEKRAGGPKAGVAQVWGRLRPHSDRIFYEDGCHRHGLTRCSDILRSPAEPAFDFRPDPSSCETEACHVLGPRSPGTRSRPVFPT